MGCDTSSEVYFLTVCVQHRSEQPLIKNDVADRLLESIRFYHERNKWWTFLALIMPDHVHLLTAFPGEIAPAMRSWKHWTAKHINVAWQRDFFDHRLRRDEHYDEKHLYILQNPVRAGLVKNWREWPYRWAPHAI